MLNLNLSVGRLLHFPSASSAFVPPAKRDDCYGRHRLVFPARKDGTSLVAEPLGHEFGFEAGNTSLMPVNFGSLEKDTRNLFIKLLGRGTPPDPARTPLEQDGYLAVGTYDDVRSLFPQDAIEPLEGGWQVIRERRQHVHREVMRTLQDASGESNFELREQSLLQPEMRKMLEQHGRIVFESDPRNADRLVVCFKHIHGTALTPWYLHAVDPSAAEHFLRHQDAIIASIRDGTAMAGQGKSQVFFETFPDRFMEGEQEHESHHIYAAGRVRSTVEALQDMNPTDEMRLLLAPFEHNIRYSLLSMLAQRGEQEAIHGDGRTEFTSEKDQLDAALQKYRAAGTNQGVGSASSYLQDVNQNQQFIYERSHASLTRNVARHTPAGSTTFMAYGAAHFGVGQCTKDDSCLPLEEYLARIPRTQVVVIEPAFHSEVLTSIDTFFDYATGVKEEPLLFLQADIMARLNNLSGTTYAGLVSGKDSSILHRGRDLADALELLRKLWKRELRVEIVQRPASPFSSIMLPWNDADSSK